MLNSQTHSRVGENGGTVTVTDFGGKIKVSNPNNELLSAQEFYHSQGLRVLGSTYNAVEEYEFYKQNWLKNNQAKEDKEPTTGKPPRGGGIYVPPGTAWPGQGGGTTNNSGGNTPPLVTPAPPPPAMGPTTPNPGVRKTSVSTYGVVVPISCGRVRLVCNLIDASDIEAKFENQRLVPVWTKDGCPVDEVEEVTEPACVPAGNDGVPV